MYRISVIITRKGYGTTLVPPFYVNMGENGVTDETSAKKAALDIIDPMGLIHSQEITTIKITVS